MQDLAMDLWHRPSSIVLLSYRENRARLTPVDVTLKYRCGTLTPGNTQIHSPVSLDFRVPNGTPTSMACGVFGACWGPIWDPERFQRHVWVFTVRYGANEIGVLGLPAFNFTL